MRLIGPGRELWTPWKNWPGKFIRKFLRRRIDAASDIKQGCGALRNTGAGFVCGCSDRAEIRCGSRFALWPGKGFDRRVDWAEQRYFERIRNDYSRDSSAANCAR